MGQFIKLKPSCIRPSQDFIKEGTARYILECYASGNLASLPPAPMVRRDPKNNGLFIAIDGHNLLAVQEARKEECECYLVDAVNDFLPNPSANLMVEQRNKDLAEKFESSIIEANRCATSFEKLARDISPLREHFKKCHGA